MVNKHMPYDLPQMQSLPLEAKIRMTQERIRAWYESWKKYTIYNTKTKKTRFVTWSEEPSEKGCYVKKKKKIDGEMVEVDVLVPGTKLKPTECIEAVEEGQVYVSFSGGKDSTVLKHIIDSMYDDVPTLFVNTGLEYPEIQAFVREIKAGKYEYFNSDVEIVRPEMRFDEVLTTYGYPVVSKEVSQTIYEARGNVGTGKYTYRLKKLNGEAVDKDGNPSTYNIPQWKYLLDVPFGISHKCCDVMKKKPAKQYEKQTGRKPIIGTMANESRLRKSKWIRFGCNAFGQKRPTSQPLSFWTEQDIYHYLKKYNVPYCSVYGDIVIDEKVDGVNVLEGQINLIDILGEYSQEDVLKTTGCDRTGCIFCMFGCHLEKEPNRFQQLKETHPRQYEYCIGGGEYSVIRVFNFKGEEIKLKHCTREQIEKWVNANRDNIRFKIEYDKWQPSKEGLGLGKVLDYIGVDYE